MGTRWVFSAFQDTTESLQQVMGSHLLGENLLM